MKPCAAQLIPNGYPYITRNERKEQLAFPLRGIHPEVTTQTKKRAPSTKVRGHYSLQEKQQGQDFH